MCYYYYPLRAQKVSFWLVLLTKIYIDSVTQRAHYFSREFAPLPFTPEMPTKKNPTLSQSVLENLEFSDAVCVITRESMDLLLNNNASLQQQTLELNKQTAKLNTNLVKTLDRLTGIMQSMADQSETSNANLGSKLDQLIEAVSKNNVKATAATDMDDLFNNRKQVIEQKVRNEKLSNYYQELLNEDPPFVRREFRTHVSKTTPERELEQRRKQAKNTVEIEISIMQDRVTTCIEKQRKLDENIRKHLQEMDAGEAETLTEQMTSQEQKITDDYEKTKMSFFKKFDEDDKGNVTEYLVKFSEDKDRYSSKNSRGQNHRRPPRRGTR